MSPSARGGGIKTAHTKRFRVPHVSAESRIADAMIDNGTNADHVDTFLIEETNGAQPQSDRVGTFPFLLPYQQQAFGELERTARVFSGTPWWELPVRPRFHRLIVAPTGTGKTHIVKTLADKLQWPFLSLTASNWILLGCGERGGKQTWPCIASWLADAATHRILFVDEIEKITGMDTWSRHLRCEIFNLLDLVVPPGLVFDRNESDEGEDESAAAQRARVISALRFQTLIVAGAAFQDVWEARTQNPMGFHAGEVIPESPNHNELAGHLSRELINRFGPLVTLPHLAETDYRQMVTATAQKLTPKFRERFVAVAERAISSAIRDRKGARFVEESVTLALMGEGRECPGHSKEGITPSPPTIF